MFNLRTFDAQAGLGFVRNQAAHIETEVNKTVYPEIQYSFLIPVDTSAHPFTRTVTYISSDQFGQARWINGNADDMPIAGNERTQHETKVYTAGIGYGYGFEEVGYAQLTGMNLQSDDAMAARRAYEEMVERVGLTTGDSEKGFESLIDHSAVTPVAANFGDWSGSATTEDQILADFNQAIMQSGADTNYTSYADTLLLPWAKMEFLASVRLGDTSDTLLKWLRMNNVYTAMTGRELTIRSVRGLETAGAGNTARMVAYRRNPQVLKLHIPMPHQFLAAWQAGPLRYEVPGVFRLGGLDIRRPAEVQYVDGI